MSWPLGVVRGLDACSSDDGRFTILALDHRQNLRRELRPDDPDVVTYEEMVDFKRAVVRHTATAGTGILLDPEVGVAQVLADGSLPATLGLIVAVEATGYLGTPGARISRILPGWGIDRIRRMGASAAKLLVYYHPDAPTATDQERLVATVAEACGEHDLPLFLEPLSYDPGGARLAPEERRRVVTETARRLVPLGATVLKAEFPYPASVTDPTAMREACEELSEVAGVPWVLLSGGVDAPTFEAQAEIACRAGASGVLAGRSIWADAATLGGAERDGLLAGSARERLSRLRAIVEKTARPWREAPGAPRIDAPPEGWYGEY
jgi:tagatose-1,6-bisphosphate aldolase